MRCGLLSRHSNYSLSLARIKTGNRRTGFTLIELLVVIAIIAVLVGLLLPAVQKVRAAAARAKCENNMKQCALGMLNYHNTYEKFPTGYVDNNAAVHDRECWFQQILPYLEQTALFALYSADTSYTINIISNTAIIDTVVPSTVCPADPSAPGRAGSMNSSGSFQGNFIANAGGVTWTVTGGVPTATEVSIGGSPTGIDSGGVFYCDSATRIADITDGTSTTLILSESIVRGSSTGTSWGEAGEYWGGSCWGAFGLATGQTPNTTVTDKIYACRSTTWPNAPCTSTGGSPLRNYARSYHIGGVNAAMCDGSVAFFTNSINATTWAELGTRADGFVPPTTY